MGCWKTASGLGVEANFEDIRIHRGKEGLVASLDQKTTDGIGIGTKLLLLHKLDVSKKMTYKAPLKLFCIFLYLCGWS